MLIKLKNYDRKLGQTKTIQTYQRNTRRYIDSVINHRRDFMDITLKEIEKLDCEILLKIMIATELKDLGLSTRILIKAIEKIKDQSITEES